MDKKDVRKLIIGGIQFLGQAGAVYILAGLIPRNVSTFGKVCGYVAAFTIGNAAGPVVVGEVLKCEQILKNLGDNRNMVIF